MQVGQQGGVGRPDISQRLFFQRKQPFRQAVGQSGIGKEHPFQQQHIIGLGRVLQDHQQLFPAYRLTVRHIQPAYFSGSTCHQLRHRLMAGQRHPGADYVRIAEKAAADE